MNGFYPEKALQAFKSYDQAEVFVSDADVHTVYIDNSRISNIESKKDTGMMFRMMQGGKMGKASVTLNSPGSFEECLGMAESVLSFSPVNEGMNPYPEPSEAKISAPKVFDRKADEVTPEELRELAQRVIDSASSFDGARVTIPRAQIRVATVRTHVMNSNGVDAEHESTLVYGHFTSMCVRDHPGEGIDFYHGTSLDLDPEAIGTSIARKANDAAICREFKGHLDIPMALCPTEGADMLFSSLGDAIDGENVKYSRSYWKDSVGQEVASPCLKVTDDPTSSAPLACVFDDEGTPTERRPILEGGVLKGFIRDSFCGDSTGNALRRSSVECMGAYERTPVIKPLNLVVKAGNKTVEDMVAEMDDVVLVDKFASPEADGLSGRFGLNVRSATVYHRGEPVQIINNALLMGNMFECMKNVQCICSDSVQTGVVNLPTICYGGTEMAGN